MRIPANKQNGIPTKKMAFPQRQKSIISRDSREDGIPVPDPRKLSSDNTDRDLRLRGDDVYPRELKHQGWLFNRFFQQLYSADFTQPILQMCQRRRPQLARDVASAGSIWRSYALQARLLQLAASVANRAGPDVGRRSLERMRGLRKRSAVVAGQRCLQSCQAGRRVENKW